MMCPVLKKRILATWAVVLAVAAGGTAHADDSVVGIPTVATDPFNRTQTLDDLYVALANREAAGHWTGNVKKYRLKDGDIYENSDKLASQAASQKLMQVQPALVIYGGTPRNHDVDDAVLYVATNDGFLHAVDARTDVEQWAYELRNDSPGTAKYHSLDGGIRVLKYDTNGDGVVDPSDNDRVILFLGQARGGSRYYAIDVTGKKPQFLWSIGPSTAGLERMGETWSTPAIARVHIAGVTQNSQQFVLIFGGGYDGADESQEHGTTGARGNAIYMVDALKGTVLWSASSSRADLVLKRMDHPIPSEVAVLDLDGDGYADRMYVGDMAAQLWRFDISNGMPIDDLVSGGVLASLGTRDDSTHTNAAARHFYNRPDVAAIRRKGIPPFLNIALGSGHREQPQSTEVQDRFYSIRDYRAFERLGQEEYDSPKRKILQDEDLVDVSANVGSSKPPASTALTAKDAGWKLLFDTLRSCRVGEKVLASASTFNGQILFPTYTPGNATSAACMAGSSTNRLYVLDAFDGNGQYTALSQRGIAPQVIFLFPRRGGNPAGAPHFRPVVCLSGVEVLDACRHFSPLVKTYWSESGAR